eukprot:2260074-Rhodomonas_salina.1
MWNLLKDLRPSATDLGQRPIFLDCRTACLLSDRKQFNQSVCGLCTLSARLGVSCDVCRAPLLLPEASPFLSRWDNDGTCLPSMPPPDYGTQKQVLGGPAGSYNWLQGQIASYPHPEVNTDSQGRVSFDFGSVRMRTLMTEGKGTKVTACSS